MFEVISTFGMQNPIVGSLLQEFDIGKNNLASELIKKAPRPGVDLDIQKKLEELRKGNNKVDNNNNFNILIPLPLPLPPLSFNSFQTILQAPPPLLSSPPFIVTAEANTEAQTNCYPTPANNTFWRNDKNKT